LLDMKTGKLYKPMTRLLSIDRQCMYSQSLVIWLVDVFTRSDLSKLMEIGAMQSTTLWQEVEDSFVSNVVGGQGTAGSKL
jgi:hypothetical protein